MQNLEISPYTRQEVTDALHAKSGVRHIRFRYDLLDKLERKIGELKNVLSGSVAMSAFSTIKRTAKFKIRESGEINYLTDRIQPFYELKMPDGKWLSYSLGIFLLSSPTRKEDGPGIIREIDAFDGLIILKNDKFDSRYFIAVGTNYKTAITAILNGAGITKWNIQDTDKVLGRDLEWEPGTEKIEVINDLLSQIIYYPLSVDVWGYYRSEAYKSPSTRTAEYEYKTDELSVLFNGSEEELDLFEVPNKWVVTVSNPEQPPLVSVITNDNPESLLSTVSRGITIVDYRTLEDIADQQALNQYAQKIATEASEIYGKIVFETAIMPHHDYHDILYLEQNSLGIADKYSETSWEMSLEAGGKMKHECRKVVKLE